MVLGPFVLKFTHWVSGNFSIKTVSAESLDHEARVFLEKARGEIESINFEFVGYMTLSDYMPNVSTCFALFMDHQSKTSAMAAVIRQKTGKTLPYYEFTSRYSNGRVINVNNSPMLGSYRNPDKSSYRYPKIKSVKNLYDIHRWVTGHDKKAIDPVGYDKDRAAEMLTEVLIDELKLQQQFGYYDFDQEKARFLFTWKGALIMTEKNVFPVKNILDHLDLRSAQKAITGMPTQPKLTTAGGTGRESGKNEELGAGLKSEGQFKSGANWFFWIAALSFINSLAAKFDGSWNFIIGLGITQVIDSIALSAKEVSPGIAFQALILLIDLGFAALFTVFGLMAQKRSLDSFEVGMVFYAFDSLIFLLTFDILGIVFHGIALFFLYRGWNGLRRLQESSTVQAPVPG